jgi:hypothetical protein
MATKADLRRMVLSHLAVIDATEDPDPEQASLVDLWIDGARGQLVEKGLCWWDEDAIPTAALVPLVRYVASLSPASFGRAGKGYEAYESLSLRQIAALKSDERREDVRGDYA